MCDTFIGKKYNYMKKLFILFVGCALFASCGQSEKEKAIERERAYQAENAYVDSLLNKSLEDLVDIYKRIDALEKKVQADNKYIQETEDFIKECNKHSEETRQFIRELNCPPKTGQ